MLYIFIALAGVFFFVSVCLLIHIFRLKIQLREIKNQLFLTKDKSYNRQITVSLFDKDLSDMAAELNKNLDYQKKMKLMFEQAERSLKESVSDIAHDLRTPLTVVKGNLQMLKAGERLSEKGVTHLDVCIQKSDEMKNMADNFFELSVLESDTSPVKTDRVSAVNVLMQFLADNEAVIRGAAFVPEISFPEKSVFILADEQLLMRMLGNLLNNVMKYAKERFSIALKELDDERCAIIFSNSIDDDTQLDTERLFNRTYRGDKPRRGGGAGLGLYIVKLLAEKQGAFVQAEINNKKLEVKIIFKKSVI